MQTALFLAQALRHRISGWGSNDPFVRLIRECRTKQHQGGAGRELKSLYGRERGLFSGGLNLS
jgi:hypothetical protein